MGQTTLSRYYAILDDGRLKDALALLDDKVTFTMLLPSGALRGASRDQMETYLTGRGVSNRRHTVLREARDGDTEFVYGQVTDGNVTTGHFLAGARLSHAGLVESYQVTFDTEHRLVGD